MSLHFSIPDPRIGKFFSVLVLQLFVNALPFGFKKKIKTHCFLFVTLTIQTFPKILQIPLLSIVCCVDVYFSHPNSLGEMINSVL